MTDQELKQQLRALLYDIASYEPMTEQETRELEKVCLETTYAETESISS